MTYEESILAALARRSRTVSELLRSNEVDASNGGELRDPDNRYGRIKVGSRLLTPTLLDLERRGLAHHTVGTGGRFRWHHGPAHQEALDV